MPSRSRRPCRSAICWRPTAGRWRPVASLYPAQQAQQRLFDYARPQLEFHGLLRPGDFRQALRDLRLALTLPRQPALQAAACLLGERDEDERLLQMALNLLHKV